MIQQDISGERLAQALKLALATQEVYLLTKKEIP